MVVKKSQDSIDAQEMQRWRDGVMVSNSLHNCEALLREHKENLASIDRTIHIFDTSYDLKTIKAKRVSKERYFKNGETVVLILDTLSVEMVVIYILIRMKS
ncbi:MAG: hypothetical protein NTW78_12060 [Campylobacterales bacterium]|nr:hypothetical protein [Campylobacterales bacterium]